MTRFKYILILIPALFFFNGCEYAFQKDIASVSPVAVYTADSLINILKQNERINNEEVIVVSGLIKETNLKNNKFNILLKGKTNQDHYIICEMKTKISDSVLNLSQGDTLSVKGILKGYLNDAVLLNCIVVNTTLNE